MAILEAYLIFIRSIFNIYLGIFAGMTVHHNVHWQEMLIKRICTNYIFYAQIISLVVCVNNEMKDFLVTVFYKGSIWNVII